MTTEDLMNLADAYAETMYLRQDRYEARQALLDALEALGREVAELKVRVQQADAQHVNFVLGVHSEVCTERDTLRAELEAIRAQEPDLNDLLQGKLVSMDVSTGEDDAYNRVFGRVCEVMLQSCGSEEDTILAIEESRNFASPAAKDAGLVAVMHEAADRLEGIKGGSVSETIAMMRKALSEIGGV